MKCSNRPAGFDDGVCGLTDGPRLNALLKNPALGRAETVSPRGNSCEQDKLETRGGSKLFLLSHHLILCKLE